MKLNYYTSKSGKNDIIEYVCSLPADERADGFTVLEALENGEFSKIKFKQWQKKVYEVYFYKHNRIFYVTVDEGQLYILHACRKQKNKTEKRDQEIVIKRAKEVGQMYGKRFI